MVLKKWKPHRTAPHRTILRKQKPLRTAPCRKTAPRCGCTPWKALFCFLGKPRKKWLGASRFPRLIMKSCEHFLVVFFSSVTLWIHAWVFVLSAPNRRRSYRTIVFQIFLFFFQGKQENKKSIKYFQGFETEQRTKYLERVAFQRFFFNMEIQEVAKKKVKIQTKFLR